MKKNLLFSALILTLGLSSCNLESNDDENFEEFTLPAVNLIIPAVGGDAYASYDNYAIRLYPYSGTMSLSSTNLVVDNNSYPFTTSLMNFGVTNTDIIFEGGQYSGNGLTITKLSGYTSQALYPLPSREMYNSVPAYPYNPPREMLVLNYLANFDYSVYTFSPDALFSGKTDIITVGAGPTFSGTDTYYRVIFSSDLKSANIIFYNAKFADRMPYITFIVRGLEVSFSKSGYSLHLPEGVQFIIPELPEGTDGQFTPYDSYRFNMFNFTSSISSQLTEANLNCRIQYVRENQVTAEYTTMFAGSYLNRPNAE